MTGLAEAVQQAVGQPASVRIGTVTSITPFVVSAQGVPFEDVGWLGSYLPQTGDTVILLGQSSESGSDPASWAALGVASATPGRQLHLTKLIRNAPQNIPNNAFTPISWDGIFIDTMGALSGGVNLIVPFDGWYMVSGHGSFAPNVTGIRQGLFFLNGGSTDSFVSANATSALGHRFALPNTYLEMAAGDVIQMLQWQNSGVALNTDSAVGTRPTVTLQYLGTAV